MCSLTRFMASVAAVALASLTASSMAVLATGPASAAPPSTTGATTVPLRQVYRGCDFSDLSRISSTGHGTGFSIIRSSGSTASAEVHLLTAEPGTHYDVGLIQTPRPSSATCGPGDPGTAFGSINTDGAGSGTVSVQEGIRQGTTGLWVTIARLDEHSQSPAEFYTSDFIATV